MRRELSVVAREPYDKCFSQVAARRTGDFGIDQEIDPGSDLSRCRAAQNNRQVQVIGDSRCYAESWQIARKRKEAGETEVESCRLDSRKTVLVIFRVAFAPIILEEPYRFLEGRAIPGFEESAVQISYLLSRQLDRADAFQRLPVRHDLAQAANRVRRQSSPRV